MTRCLRKNAALIIILGISIVLGGVYTAEASKQIPLSGTSWNVTGTARVHVKVPHQGSKTDVVSVNATITFNSDGSFTGGTYNGTWTQKGNKYKLNVTQSIIDYIENLLADKGITGTVTAKSISVGGTVSSTKTSEKITMTADVAGTVAVTSPIATTAKFTTTINLKGAPASALSPGIAGEEELPQSLSGIFDGIVNGIVEAINGDQ